MTDAGPRVTIHMAASLDGFIARKDGGVDWMETSDEFADGATMDPEFVAAFLKTIDCYVMGSRTYETALNFRNERRAHRSASRDAAHAGLDDFVLMNLVQSDLNQRVWTTPNFLNYG